MNSIMVSRKRLMDVLDGLSTARIIYICAPAGCGKTVAVRQWLDMCGGRSAVMTLDEYDNDIAHFCLWFCAALRECQPENTALHEIVAHPSFGTAPALFAAQALSSLADGESTRLAVDDLHFVHDESVLKLLLSFLKRLPASFQIVLISRNELPPGFPELLMKGELARVTAEQLQFDAEEIAQLYKKNGASISEAQTEEVYRFTGGWAIGVSAVVLSGGIPEGDSLKYLEDYIKTHVWLRWDERTREFLLKTSAVHELTPALGTALTGEEDSGELLEELIRQNAFISCDRNGAYRYHRLFGACLTNMLSERGGEYLRSLQSKAGYWYLDEGDFYNAVDYFIKSENYDGIAASFDFLEEFDRNSFSMNRILPALRSQTMRSAAEQYPFLYLMMASAALAEGRASDMAYCMDNYYARFPEIVQRTPELAYNIFYLRILDVRAPLSALLQEIAALPAALDTVGGRSTITQNMPLLHRSSRDFSEWALMDVEATMAEVTPVLRGLFGEEADVLVECMTAGLLYEQGHSERAYSHALSAGVEIKEHFAAETKFCAMAIHVYIADAMNKHGQADDVIGRIAGMIERDGAFFLDYNFKAMVARRAFANGNMQAADDWLSENVTQLYSDLDFHRLYGHITTCRAFITKGDYDSAIILLTKVLELATALNRPLDIIETRILLSISCWKKKRSLQSEAIQHLEQAVLLAHSYGYTQMFAGMGAELSGMLLRLQHRAEQRSGDNPPPASFIKLLYMKAAEREGGGLTSEQPEKAESFTDKQKAVMALLCEGKSYREMSEALGVGRPTLRSHLSLIYKKLDVTNESDAIKKIKALGILENNEY